MFNENTDFVQLQTDNFIASSKMLNRTEIEERRKIFKNILLEITNYHQNVFLDSKNIEHIDSFKLKTWHSQFILDNIPDIPIFEMKEKPNIKVTTIGNFIQDNDVKNILVNEAINNLKTNNNINKFKFSIDADEDKDDDTKSKSSSGILENYLSSNLIARVIINNNNYNYIDDC